ncbi:transferrin-binding protein-like solute binding protein [Testudinibacter sp. P27/CKL/0425]
MKQRTLFFYSILLSTALLLAACGGNGGIVEDPKPVNSKPAKAPVVNFTGDVSLPEASKKVPEQGSFLTKDFNYDHRVSPTVRLQSRKRDGNETLTVEYEAMEGTAGNGKKFNTGLRTVYYDKDGKLEAILMGFQNPDIKLAETTISKKFKLGKELKKVTTYDEAFGLGTYRDAGLKQGDKYAGAYASNEDGESYIWRDPAVAGWNYQTYGAFSQCNEQTESVWVYQSVGDQTRKAIPTQGKAEYKGIASASHYDKGTDKPKSITAEVLLKTDFAKREIEFSTSKTKVYILDSNSRLGDGVDKKEWDLSGKATWDKGTNNFKGDDLATTDKKFTGGKIDGRFYGERVEEVGGVFGLSNKDGKEQLLGAFGARRE